MVHTCSGLELSSKISSGELERIVKSPVTVSSADQPCVATPVAIKAAQNRETPRFVREPECNLIRLSSRCWCLVRHELCHNRLSRSQRLLSNRAFMVLI